MDRVHTHKKKKAVLFKETTYLFVVPLRGRLLRKRPVFCATAADDVKSEAALEGRLNGDKDALDEMDESRKEEKNGFKAKFMFNIADGGFTGEKTSRFGLKKNERTRVQTLVDFSLCVCINTQWKEMRNSDCMKI